MENSLQKYDAGQRLAWWSDAVRRCRSSSLPVNAWCEQEGIKVKTYYYWQKKIFRAACEEAEFVEVRPIQEKTDIVAEVSVNGIIAAIHNGADASTLQNLLTAMKRC